MLIILNVSGPSCLLIFLAKTFLHNDLEGELHPEAEWLLDAGEALGQ